MIRQVEALVHGEASAAPKAPAYADASDQDLHALIQKDVNKAKGKARTDSAESGASRAAAPPQPPADADLQASAAEHVARQAQSPHGDEAVDPSAEGIVESMGSQAGDLREASASDAAPRSADEDDGNSMEVEGGTGDAAEGGADEEEWQDAAADDGESAPDTNDASKDPDPFAGSIEDYDDEELPRSLGADGVADPTELDLDDEEDARPEWDVGNTLLDSANEANAAVHHVADGDHVLDVIDEADDEDGEDGAADDVADGGEVGDVASLQPRDGNELALEDASRDENPADVPRLIRLDTSALPDEADSDQQSSDQQSSDQPLVAADAVVRDVQPSDAAGAQPADDAGSSDERAAGAGAAAGRPHLASLSAVKGWATHDSTAQAAAADDAAADDAADAAEVAAIVAATPGDPGGSTAEGAGSGADSPQGGAATTASSAAPLPGERASAEQLLQAQAPSAVSASVPGGDGERQAFAEGAGGAFPAGGDSLGSGRAGDVPESTAGDASTTVDAASLSTRSASTRDMGADEGLDGARSTAALQRLQSGEPGEHGTADVGHGGAIAQQGTMLLTADAAIMRLADQGDLASAAQGAEPHGQHAQQLTGALSRESEDGGAPSFDDGEARLRPSGSTSVLPEGLAADDDTPQGAAATAGAAEDARGGGPAASLAQLVSSAVAKRSAAAASRSGEEAPPAFEPPERGPLTPRSAISDLDKHVARLRANASAILAPFRDSFRLTGVRGGAQVFATAADYYDTSSAAPPARGTPLPLPKADAAKLFGNDGHLAPRERRCAVVGNSRTLLAARLGREIDAADFVVRLNQAPTAGLEDHVGSRTDARIVNHKWLHGYGSNPRLQLEQSAALWVSRTDWQEFGPGVQRIERVRGHPVRARLLSKALTNTVNSALAAVRAALANWLSVEYAGKGSPSSGMLGVWLLLNKCDNVTTYGIANDAAPDDGTAWHYFEDRSFRSSREFGKAPHHSFDLEFDALELLDAAGMLRHVTVPH